MNEGKPELDLSAVEAALERGDYGQSLEMLSSLAELYPLTDPNGPYLRLLMVTAWMGQGQDDQALSTCRALCQCRDSDLRQQARQLLTILEAPSLERPERWSIRLPQLEMNATGQGITPSGGRRRSRKKDEPPPPPTGPTRGPALGFGLLVSAVLLGLTLLLSGCVRIDADLELPGPDRMQMQWQIQSLHGRRLPWQERFEQSLSEELPDLHINHPGPGAASLSTSIQPSQELNLQLQRIVDLAGRSAGVVLPSPELTLQERNWLIGVHQTLHLNLDLSSLPAIPDLTINLSLDHGRQHHRLNSGERTQIELETWRWNPLGLGCLVVLLLLVLSLWLQIIRRRLFGFPELPS